MPRHRDYSQNFRGLATLFLRKKYFPLREPLFAFARQTFVQGKTANDCSATAGGSPSTAGSSRPEAVFPRADAASSRDLPLSRVRQSLSPSPKAFTLGSLPFSRHQQAPPEAGEPLPTSNCRHSSPYRRQSQTGWRQFSAGETANYYREAENWLFPQPKCRGSRLTAMVASLQVPTCRIGLTDGVYHLLVIGLDVHAENIVEDEAWWIYIIDMDRNDK